MKADAALSVMFPRFTARTHVRNAVLKASRHLPWEVRLHQNQLLNRFVVDALGYSAWSVLMARNTYERLEKAGDWLAWIVAGLILPVMVLRPYANRVERQLRQQFPSMGNIGKTAQSSFLEQPFEQLESAFRRSPRRFRAMSAKVLNAKVAILAVDLGILAAKGQGYAWVKNAVTEKLSGKKGFSGEFNYASDRYLQEKSQAYEANKSRLMRRSMLIGFGSALLFPALVWATVKSPNRRDPMVGFLKRQLPLLNYADAIYMSKWVLLWHNLFNWTLPTLLSSRDSHEFRENVVKLATFDILFFFGDDVIAGLAGRALKRQAGVSLTVPILKRHPSWTGLPRLRPLHEVYHAVRGNVRHPSYQLTRQSAWVGLLGTAALMGVSMPMLNRWYTQQKVLQEQAQQKRY